MEDSWMDIGYVVVDDFDFTPIGVSAHAKMKPTQEVLDLIRQVRADNPELLKYGMIYFQVVKILQPVPRETITPGQDSETLKRNGRGSLQSILAQFRERSKAATRAELANEYVKVLNDEYKLQDCFQHTDRALVSAIVVRLTTPEERFERYRKLPLEAGMSLRRENLYGIVHPPSIISGHHGIHLRRFALRDGPADRYTFPVALFDKNLALLQYRLENLDVVSKSNKSAYLFPNELDFYEVADGFILAAIAEHASDEKRVDASRPFLEAIFRKDLELEYKVARSETYNHHRPEDRSTRGPPQAVGQTLCGGGVCIQEQALLRLHLFPETLHRSQRTQARDRHRSVPRNRRRRRDPQPRSARRLFPGRIAAKGCTRSCGVERLLYSAPCILLSAYTRPALVVFPFADARAHGRFSAIDPGRIRHSTRHPDYWPSEFGDWIGSVVRCPQYHDCSPSRSELC